MVNALLKEELERESGIYALQLRTLNAEEEDVGEWPIWQGVILVCGYSGLWLCGQAMDKWYRRWCGLI